MGLEFVTCTAPGFLGSHYPCWWTLRWNMLRTIRLLLRHWASHVMPCCSGQQTGFEYVQIYVRNYTVVKWHSASTFPSSLSYTASQIIANKQTVRTVKSLVHFRIHSHFLYLSPILGYLTTYLHLKYSHEIPGISTIDSHTFTTDSCGKITVTHWSHTHHECSHTHTHTHSDSYGKITVNEPNNTVKSQWNDHEITVRHWSHTQTLS